MDSEQRATVLGYLLLATEDLKAAAKEARKGEAATVVGSTVQHACERLAALLTITGIQMTFHVEAVPA